MVLIWATLIGSSDDEPPPPLEPQAASARVVAATSAVAASRDRRLPVRWVEKDIACLRKQVRRRRRDNGDRAVVRLVRAPVPGTADAGVVLTTARPAASVRGTRRG